MPKPEVPKSNFAGASESRHCGFDDCAVAAGKSRQGYGLGNDLPVWSGPPEPVIAVGRTRGAAEKAA